jgi:hypothetical protein
MCLNVVKEGENEYLFSGSTDGTVTMSGLDKNGAITSQLMTLNLGVTPRSVDFMQKTLLVGS